MATFIHDGPDDQRLLLYLAGELAGEEREQLDRRLQSDPILAERLAELVRLDRTIAAHLDREAAESRPADETAIRGTVREMNRYQIELLARPVAPAESRFRLHRMPKWALRAVAVAAVICLLMGLWGLGVFDVAPKNDQIVDRDDAPSQVESQLAVMDKLLVPGASSQALDVASEHVDQLQSREDEDALLLMM